MRDYKAPRAKKRPGILTSTGRAWLITLLFMVAVGLLVNLYRQAHKPLPEINSYDMNGALRYQAKEMVK